MWIKDDENREYKGMQTTKIKIEGVKLIFQEKVKERQREINETFKSES